MRPPGRLTLRPHAKINLGLRVLGTRSDGYHEIRTRFQTIDLADELEIEASSNDVELAVEGEALAADRTNLVWRAAELIRSRRSGLPGARLRLKKSIPIAAGLGGGSSDAAATLLALNRLWGFPLERHELVELAIRLGADVPFFLHGGLALGTGKGDDLEPLPDRDPFPVCLILPPYGSPTEEVYRLWDRRRPAAIETVGAEAAVVSEDTRSVHNDLQETVFSLHPELGAIHELLYRAGAFAASLSGSGSSLYGLFRSPEEIRALRESRDWGAFKVLTCRTVSRPEYCRALGAQDPFEPGSS
ncbi:MAG TPA: 4-(cytidine 5'-diphospho)-2-C-methyl-D-erythritol kinase [Candidatus Polarisedimenticolia bacterium]|jgi:4-diphosphocytidyl-2-C-methyl-D-erythritol kinase|nr:4-(cytidine 5'-diphospho)-2-C-methyl-D-erythritol kinase [Candidatus Polarisedimenticolia bacterium]